MGIAIVISVIILSPDERDQRVSATSLVETTTGPTIASAQETSPEATRSPASTVTPETTVGATESEENAPTAPTAQPTATSVPATEAVPTPTTAPESIETPDAQSLTVPSQPDPVETAINNSRALGNLQVSGSGKEYLLTSSDGLVGFQVIYRPAINIFLVVIVGWPFEELRQEGERELLRLTELSEPEACELLQVEVWAGPAYREDPSVRYDIPRPLSFCVGK